MSGARDPATGAFSPPRPEGVRSRLPALGSNNNNNPRGPTNLPADPNNPRGRPSLAPLGRGNNNGNNNNNNNNNGNNNNGSHGQNHDQNHNYGNAGNKSRDGGGGGWGGGNANLGGAGDGGRGAPMAPRTPERAQAGPSNGFAKSPNMRPPLPPMTNNADDDGLVSYNNNNGNNNNGNGNGHDIGRSSENNRENHGGDNVGPNRGSNASGGSNEGGNSAQAGPNGGSNINVHHDQGPSGGAGPGIALPNNNNNNNNNDGNNHGRNGNGPSTLVSRLWAASALSSRASFATDKDQAEVHFRGTILSCDRTSRMRSARVRYHVIQPNPHWRLLCGSDSGATHCDTPDSADTAPFADADGFEHGSARSSVGLQPHVKDPSRLFDSDGRNQHHQQHQHQHQHQRQHQRQHHRHHHRRDHRHHGQDPGAETTGGFVFAHPVELKYATSTAQDWPRLRLELWEVDSYGREVLAGAGVCELPRGVGEVVLECHTWRPAATLRERVLGFFLGVLPQQSDVLSVTDAKKRAALRTVGVGRIVIEMAVLIKKPRSGNVIHGLAV